ncbi:transposase family protein [Saccharopolyspora shandongensis]|uniref:transposase family protein n=1 Tax=Saccharopolyspora shandongensis TaxID=418495 RepID=UPI003F4DCED2
MPAGTHRTQEPGIIHGSPEHSRFIVGPDDVEFGCCVSALLDDGCPAQLATDNDISRSITYDFLHEGITALAARAPKLESALFAAKIAGHGHTSIDGALIETDRCRTPGPTAGVNLWWSGKHANHGGNIQVITAPDGWPLWTSDVRPGGKHDTTALRTHTEILPALGSLDQPGLPVLGDLGYESEADTITVAFKKPQGRELTEQQKEHNKAHNGKRATHPPMPG